MGKIQQLPKSVSNQISAGEVIERPASVVKELVENSIDAAATRIIIDIENGGKDKIRVKDNGRGIAAEDMEIAFARYATSKIDSINDLYSIKTLGFRGEALASIAAVSRVKISSKTEEAIKGKILKLKGGEIEKQKSTGIPAGTDITVSNLFYNTPARYKYLKTTNTEFGHISKVITREALAYPGIQFQLKHNNNQIFKTPGTVKMKDTIHAIYGQEMIENLIPLEYEENYIQVKGFIAHPNFNRSSRVYQLFFVNKRSVHNRSLTRGAEAGYRGLLPPGKYPVFFLNLKLNQILVDVNVHPTKREIKFSREKIVKNVIKNSVKSALDNIDVSPRIKMGKSNKDQNNQYKQPLDFKNSNSYTKTKNNKQTKDNSTGNNAKPASISGNYPDIEKESSSRTREKTTVNYKANNNLTLEKDKSSNTKSYSRDVQNNLPQKIKKIMGQITNTYIIAEGNDGLFIIDQHNAHERILFDRLYKYYREQKIKSQSLLVPVTVDVSPEEIEVVNKHIDRLKKLGIEIESFGGNSFIIKEVPMIIKKRSNKKVIRELIDKLLTGNDNMNQAEMIKTMILYMACRGAIKAGKQLEDVEMVRLTRDLFDSSNPYRCPHGRPIIIHITEDDIKKGMGR
ncbi:MAG: DNA mismatch repair endonuclease MutL [Halanaerobiaceae bacterium]